MANLYQRLFPQIDHVRIIINSDIVKAFEDAGVPYTVSNRITGHYLFPRWAKEGLDFYYKNRDQLAELTLTEFLRKFKPELKFP